MEAKKITSKGLVEYQRLVKLNKELYEKLVNVGAKPKNGIMYYSEGKMDVLQERNNELKKMLHAVKGKQASSSADLPLIEPETITTLGEKTKVKQREIEREIRAIRFREIKDEHPELTDKQINDQVTKEIREEKQKLGMVHQGRQPKPATEDVSTSVGSLTSYTGALANIEQLLSEHKIDEAEEIATKTLEQALISFVKGEIKQDEFNNIKTEVTKVIRKIGIKSKKVGETFHHDFKDKQIKLIKL